MGNSVDYEVRDRVGWITLDHPENHNALTAELTAELDQYFEEAHQDDEVRVIVLGANGRNFCAGADLKSAGKGAVGIPGRHGSSPYTSILTQILNGPKPVIGRIQGGAYAGGLGLSTACDITIVGDTAQFSFTEVRLGLAPWMLSVVLERKGVMTRCATYLLNGERFDAARALELGLVQRVAPADGLDAAVQDELDKLMQCAPNALRETKRILSMVPTLPVDDAFGYAEKQSAALFQGEEGQEGMAAFREKRKPSWAT